jgi:hypothetical protein
MTRRALSTARRLSFSLGRASFERRVVDRIVARDGQSVERRTPSRSAPRFQATERLHTRP